VTGGRILVLAPHPDDEVVGCAAAIARARLRGARVFVLYLTTGLPAAELAWPWHRRSHARRVARRRGEAAEVAARLDVQPVGAGHWPSRSLRLHLHEARALVAARAAACAADTVWVPAYEGGHQDHDAANLIASTLAGVQVLEFAEYNACAGVRSHEFPAITGGELALALTAAEAQRKRALLACYRSERGNLRHVRVERECFRPLPRHDYRRAPHPGTLFYQRFQWIPLHHPRVDDTPPAEVCAAFARYLAAAAAATPPTRNPHATRRTPSP
jgi:LmbE family N-acetylglucosaminyl deacetylase